MCNAVNSQTVAPQLPLPDLAQGPLDPMAIVRQLLQRILANGGVPQAACAPSAAPTFPCGAPFMGVPFQNCLPQAFNGCFPDAAAFTGCAPPPPPPPKPAPSKIKKAKEWKQGMVDSSGKEIPKPPKSGSNAHFDKEGNFTKWTSPLTFDLNNDGKAGATSIANGRKGFDIDGDGVGDDTAWAEKGDGVLAFDADGDGKAGTSGKELFGNATDLGDGAKQGNGFKALASLAEKKLGAQAVKDGKLDAKELEELEKPVAEGGAGLTMLVDGRQVKPTELGMSEIDLGYDEVGDNMDANGNEHKQVGKGFVRNGQRGAVDDIWFANRRSQ